MDISTLNIWAILVATLSTFAIGAPWYSPVLFGKVWMIVVGVSEEKVQQRNMKNFYKWELLDDCLYGDGTSYR